MTEQPPAGWYPDSEGTVRWWDGTQWTEHQPPPPPTQVAPPEPAPEPPENEADVGVLAGPGEPRELRRQDGGRRASVETSSRPGQDSGSGKGLAMTALGIAIASLLLCWIPIVNNVVFFLGVVGLIVSVIAYQRARKGKADGRGMAFAAILISVLSLVGVLATQAYYGSVLDDIGEAIEGGADSTPSESDKKEAATAKTLPIGESAQVGSEYTVAVTKVNLDADKVLARDEFFNEPPKGRYILMTLDVTYKGDDEGDPWSDLEGTFVGSDSRQYDASACPATVPDSGYDVPTLNSGGKAKFKACFDVPPDAIDGGKLFIDLLAAFDKNARVYWAIR